MHEEAAGVTLRTVRWSLRLIAATTLAGLLAGTLWMRLTQPQYTATMVIGPLANQGATGLGTRIAGSGAFARLPEGEQMSDFGRLLAMLTSSPVAAALAADRGVMRKVFADAWSEAAGHWREPEGWGPGLRRAVLRLAGRPAWIPPDMNQLAAHLRDRVRIARIEEMPLQRITYRHPDRAFALSLLARLYDMADERLRDEAGRRVSIRVEFLRNRLGTTTQVAHRAILADMLEDYERVLLTLGTDLPFAADLIEPPRAGVVPDWPDPMIVIPLTAGAGLVFGVLVVFAVVGTRDGGKPPEGEGGGYGQRGRRPPVVASNDRALAGDRDRSGHAWSSTPLHPRVRRRVP